MAGISEFLSDKLLRTYIIFPFLDQLFHTVRIERQCSTEIVLDGIRLQPGDDVAAAVNVIHKNPEYYPEPEKFDPDRWNLSIFIK